MPLQHSVATSSKCFCFSEGETLRLQAQQSKSPAEGLPAAWLRCLSFSNQTSLTARPGSRWPRCLGLWCPEATTSFAYLIQSEYQDTNWQPKGFMPAPKCLLRLQNLPATHRRHVESGIQAAKMAAATTSCLYFGNANPALRANHNPTACLPKLPGQG